ncbi:MAG TPA: ABC transporter permease [Blastocatellia bacterium]|nr:ABC transporter permease [Blastocatellia bacterium]
MPFELFIAVRYLKAKRKQVMISVITVIAVCAVAAGVASLITVLAMMTGFRDDFQQKILAGTAHLNLTRKAREPMPEYRELVAKLSKLPHIRTASATVYQRVLIQGSNDTDGAILKGVDLSAPRNASEVFQFNVEGDPDSIGQLETDPDTGSRIDHIIVGRGLAQHVGLKVGELATIISPQGHLTPVGVAPRYTEFRVTGIFESGLEDYDQTWAYISLDAAEKIAGEEDVAEVIQMKVDDVDSVKEIGRQVMRAVGDNYSVQDWQDLNAPIYSALSYEKYLSGIALLIVIGIAALNIITVLIMIVMEKQRDIAVLKSMGATSRSVMYLFMLQGVIIGAVGMVLGTVIGTSFCYLANTRHWIKLPVGAYALDYLPFHANVRDVVIVATVTLAISFLSTVFPSWTAARLDPVEALRYE